MGRFFQTSSPDLVDGMYQAPWDLAEKALAYNQTGYDTAQQSASLFNSVKINHIPDEETAKIVANKLALYQDPANEFAQQLQKDPTQWKSITPAIRNLGNALQKDMTDGDLATVQNNYAQYQEALKDYNTKRAIDPITANAVFTNTMNRYKEDPERKSFNWSPIITMDIMNNPTVQKTLSDLKPSEKWQDADGKWWISKGGVAPQRIEDYIMSLYTGSPEGKAYLQQQIANKIPGWYDSKTNSLLDTHVLMDAKTGKIIDEATASKLRAAYNALPAKTKQNTPYPIRRDLNPDSTLANQIKGLTSAFSYEKDGKPEVNQFALEDAKYNHSAALQNARFKHEDKKDEKDLSKYLIRRQAEAQAGNPEAQREIDLYYPSQKLKNFATDSEYNSKQMLEDITSNDPTTKNRAISAYQGMVSDVKTVLGLHNTKIQLTNKPYNMGTSLFNKDIKPTTSDVGRLFNYWKQQKLKGVDDDAILDNFIKGEIKNRGVLDTTTKMDIAKGNKLSFNDAYRNLESAYGKVMKTIKNTSDNRMEEIQKGTRTFASGQLNPAGQATMKSFIQQNLAYGDLYDESGNKKSGATNPWNIDYNKIRNIKPYIALGALDNAVTFEDDKGHEYTFKPRDINSHVAQGFKGLIYQGTDPNDKVHQILERPNAAQLERQANMFSREHDSLGNPLPSSSGPVWLDGEKFQVRKMDANNPDSQYHVIDSDGDEVGTFSNLSSAENSIRIAHQHNKK